MIELMVEIETVREWAVKHHVECPRPVFPWQQTWEWSECRLCLFTWRGMSEEHDPACPANSPVIQNA